MTPQASAAAVQEWSSVQALSQRPSLVARLAVDPGEFWNLGIYALFFTFSSSPWIFLCCCPRGCEVICYI